VWNCPDTDSSGRSAAGQAKTADPSLTIVACNRSPCAGGRRREPAETVVTVECVYKAGNQHWRLGIRFCRRCAMTFIIFEQWSESRLVVASNHVAHPGGRSYDTFPYNRQRGGPRRGALPAVLSIEAITLGAGSQCLKRPSGVSLYADLRRKAGI